MVIYPEGVWYSCPTKADIDEVLETHLVKGGRVERLMLQTADKLPADRKRVKQFSLFPHLRRRAPKIKASRVTPPARPAA